MAVFGVSIDRPVLSSYARVKIELLLFISSDKQHQQTKHRPNILFIMEGMALLLGQLLDLEKDLGEIQNIFNRSHISHRMWKR